MDHGEAAMTTPSNGEVPPEVIPPDEIWDLISGIAIKEEIETMMNHPLLDPLLKDHFHEVDRTDKVLQREHLTVEKDRRVINVLTHALRKM